MRARATLCVLGSLGLLAFGAAAQPEAPATAPPTGVLPPVEPQPAPAPSAQPPAPPAPPPPAAQPLPPPPAAQPVAPAQQPPPTWVSPAELPPPAAPGATPLESWLDRDGVVPVLSVGFVLGGSGEIEQECTASGTSFDIDGLCDNYDYEGESGMALRADMLFPLSRGLRLGPGALLLLNPESEIDVGQFGFENIDYETGPELALYGAIEGVFPTSPKFGLFVRGQLGVNALFKGGDQGDAIDDFRESCRESTADNCDTNEGPYLAPHIGVGFGLILQSSKIALRAELLGQYRRQPFWHTKTETGGASIEQDMQFSGTRTLLLVGLEL